MMRKFLLICFCLLTLSLLGDNLRIAEVKLLSSVGDLAEVEVQLSWSNSWCNAYNHDAVYLFGKYRLKDAPDWYHLFLSESVDDYVVPDGYALKPVNGGRGLFVYRTSEDSGKSVVSLRLKWRISGNALQVLTAEQLAAGKVMISLQGMEMVYVPTSPFYAGDGISSQCFKDISFNAIPAISDLIGTSSNFTYTGNGSESAAAHVSRVADRYNQGVYNSASRHDWCGTVFPAYWTVDFKSPRRILYFGVSGVSWGDYPPAPSGDWYLEGSADAKTWDDLWHGGADYWGQSRESYPVQQAIQVSRPGDYRYYRIRVDGSQNAGLWNNIRISNVAMTEHDLGNPASESILIDGRNNSLPEYYPDGMAGFYAMKYELTQEQYVVFLNMLNRSAQYMRTIGGLLDGIGEGEYVFGSDPKHVSFRNGIIVVERRLNSNEPYVFGCNLQASDLPDGEPDGQTVACNYLSPSDLLAYADWSGLRPLSELEYEKMCRGYYPAKPQGGDFAWGAAFAKPVTGLDAEGTENESARGSGVNVNAESKLTGPARVGIFVRPGSRIQSGNSFWGFSDLSGGLEEIYCNVGVLGRQLDRREHGAGYLQDNGEYTDKGTLWPAGAGAYGVRGGSFETESAALAVSDRSRASSFFTQLTDRFSTVGGRLGFTIEPERQTSELRLENGLTSGIVVVYDTVCGAMGYTITGEEVQGGVGCHYVWLLSEDEGNTWNLVEGENARDLSLSGLQKRTEPMVVKKLLYKRLIYTPTGYGESGIVGLVIGYGYQLSRLRDTMQPCMASPGFEIVTPLPAKYTWHCLDNDKVLKEVTGTATSSYYTASTEDMKINGKLSGGEYRIELTVVQAGGCLHREQLQVFVLPWTSAPWEGNEIMNIQDSDADFNQIENTWGGRDKQKWDITSALPGALSVDSLTGVLKGMAQTMCNITIDLVCADFPDRVYSKAVKETYRDWYFLEPGAPRTLTLLPGRYRMECMGSQGGSHSEGGVGGLGGRVWGYIELTEVQQFHIYVGRTPYNPTTGGYNGGAGSSEATLSSAGGGATDIRLVGGDWSNLTSLNSRIMVAGGGGSGGHSGRGGAGGGLEGGNASNYNLSNRGGVGGTQVRAGYCAKSLSGFGRGGVGYKHGGGGGGGYSGGGGGGTTCNSTNCCDNGGGGGSGYISGYPGCVVHSSGLVFEDPGMESGVHEGKGYVRIEQL